MPLIKAYLITIVMIKSLEKAESLKILDDNYIGHLAYVYQNRPFVIPITYYFDAENNTIICYSDEGHKINAMRKNPSVSLEVAEIESVNIWQSVLAQGEYEELQGIDSKNSLHDFSNGIKKIINKKEKSNPQFISEFSSKIYSEGIPIVFRINITDITGRQRIHKNL